MTPMTRLEIFQYLENQRREISDAEDALAEEQARLDVKKRDLAERRRAHNNTVLSQLGSICTELPKETGRGAKPQNGVAEKGAVSGACVQRWLFQGRLPVTLPS